MSYSILKLNQELETPLEHVLINSDKEGMVSHVTSHPNDFKELILLAISNKQPFSWRAAWLLWSCMKTNDKRIEKHLDKIINILDKRKDGHQRNLINILLKMRVNNEQEGLLFDTCINIWTNIDKQSSVRYKAFELVIQITKRHPELHNEVIAHAQERYIETLSDGIKKSMYKLIKSLHKKKPRTIN